MDFLESVQGFLADLGPIGAVVLAILDSAGMPTLGGPDVLLLLMASHYSKSAGLALALGILAGSALGNLVLYTIGRKGGEKLLAKFGGEQQRLWVQEKIKRYDLAAIFTATIGPPPYPTKLFILSAGVLGMKWQRLLLAVLAGRTLRYGLAWYLGLHYGAQATSLLREHYLTIFIGVVALLVLSVLFQYLKRYWSRPSA